MDIRLIRDRNELSPYLEALKAQKLAAVDTETTGLNPRCAKLRLVQIACPDLPVLVIDCFSFLPGDAGLLSEIIGSPGVKIFHNAKFDLQFLLPYGLPGRIFDTMLAAQLLRSSGGPERFSLQAAAKHYLGEEVGKEEQTSDWSGELTEPQIKYAALDAAVLPRLREAMVEKIYENGLQRVAEIEFRCAKAVAFMEYCGIHLDAQKWKALTAEKEKLRDEALAKLYEYTGRPAVQTTLWEDEVLGQSFDNNNYVTELLRRNNVPVKSTSRAELYQYAGNPLVEALTEYRKSAKALSAFLHPFPRAIKDKTGRLHARYGQISAWSGRMSCYSPNV